MPVLNIDYRRGSRELIRPLRRLGVETNKATLAFGDIAFAGNGPDGPLQVGIEFKTLSELLTAIATNRFVGHQLRGMVKLCQIRYLLIEGVHRCDPKTGMLQTRRRIRHPGKLWTTEWVDAGFGARRWLYSAFVEWKNGLPMIRMLHTANRTETLHTIFGLAHWWGKDWNKHKATKVIYNGLRPSNDLDDELSSMRALMTTVTPTRQMLAQIPLVGWEYSAAAEEAFGSVAAAVGADWRAWSRLRADGLTESGRRRPRLGVERAKKVVAMLRGLG